MTRIMNSLGKFHVGKWLWLVYSGEPRVLSFGDTVTLGIARDLPEPQLLCLYKGQVMPFPLDKTSIPKRR